MVFLLKIRDTNLKTELLSTYLSKSCHYIGHFLQLRVSLFANSLIGFEQQNVSRTFSVLISFQHLCDSYVSDRKLKNKSISASLTLLVILLGFYKRMWSSKLPRAFRRQARKKVVLIYSTLRLDAIELFRTVLSARDFWKRRHFWPNRSRLPHFSSFISACSYRNCLNFAQTKNRDSFLDYT